MAVALNPAFNLTVEDLELLDDMQLSKLRGHTAALTRRVDEVLAKRRPAPLPVRVTGVDFEVAAHAVIGPRFLSWAEAVEYARRKISRMEYRGQLINKASLEYHPRRHFQEEDTLVIYTRSFVNMRVVEPVQARDGGGPESGQDGVAMTWEVFHDGAVEAR
jgi:hypothetical protein